MGRRIHHEDGSAAENWRPTGGNVMPCVLIKASPVFMFVCLIGLTAAWLIKTTKMNCKWWQPATRRVFRSLVKYLGCFCSHQSDDLVYIQSKVQLREAVSSHCDGTDHLLSATSIIITLIKVLTHSKLLHSFIIAFLQLMNMLLI